MKREIRNAIQKAIKESELNGYKWTITENGLHWSYLSENEQFTFDNKTEENILIVRGPYCMMAIIWYEKGEKLANCETLTEAYYLATKATIQKANNIY